MARDDLTEVWTTDGAGSFTITESIENLRDLIDEAEAKGHGWLELVRVIWQDPEREGGVDERWPAFEALPLRVRVSAVTGIAASGDGTQESVHRARAYALR